MKLGGFCLVLHGHLPWVLHHGRWPHGEDWLFEAALGTWMPLLGVLDRLKADGIAPGWTVGMTPVLLEQLTHPRFVTGFADYLAQGRARAQADAAAFDKAGQAHLSHLAWRHDAELADVQARFAALPSIPAAMQAHDVELLSSNATHGYHPLMLHDRCARAQVRAGLATSERHFGVRPKGVWLPECAYRPDGPWTPIALHGDVRDRLGVATIFAGEGVRWFAVESHLAAGTPCRAYDVLEAGQPTGVSVFARHGEVSEKVWSGELGYPGDSHYREFHKRHGPQGLRYWKITGGDVDLGGKDPYYPDDIPAVIYGHAVHFVDQLKVALGRYKEDEGGYGVVCAPFDAELFGHWWYEGPQFLEAVIRRIHNDDELDLLTMEAAMEAADHVASPLPEGTWGAGGDHRVWLNDDLRWYWEIAYRAEDRFLDLWHRADWEHDASIGELMEAAARQLLLLQASDWPFVISTKGAVDYGMRRIHDHNGRFDDLCNGVEDLIRGVPLDPVVSSTLARCRLVDPVFPDLSLAWWG